MCSSRMSLKTYWYNLLDVLDRLMTSSVSNEEAMAHVSSIGNVPRNVMGG